MLPDKNLYSYKKDAFIGRVQMNTGDFIIGTVKPSGALPGVRTQGIRTCQALQDGYIAPPAPANRVMAILSVVGKKRVSRMVAAEGQQDVGVVNW